MKNFISVSDSDASNFTINLLIKKALSQGFDECRKVFANDFSGLSCCKTGFYSALLNHKAKILTYFSNPKLFKENQDLLYQYIYDSEYGLSEEEQLFYEFMIGLCRFEFCLEIVIRFCEYALTNYDLKPASDSGEDENSYDYKLEFWGSLHGRSSKVIYLMSHIADITKTFKLVTFWDMAASFFQNNILCQEFAKFLVSMQYIPNNPRMLGMAQTLHWGGFGGSGVYLEPFRELDPLMPHRIGYHGKETGGFNARLEVILSAQMQMKSALSAVMPDILKRCFSSAKNAIRILDVGSGPSYLGAKPVVDALTLLGHDIKLTASDVDESSLKKLLLEKIDSPLLDEVKYLDLSQISAIPESEIIQNNYDIVTASLVLHQLSEQKINDSISFFTKIIKPGGLIINPDVGQSGGYYQCLLVPSNEVDREGQVPGYTKYSFRKTSVISGQKSKIAYPIRNLISGFPSNEVALYAIAVYIVIELPATVVPTLEMLWHTGKYEEADQMAQDYSSVDICSSENYKSIRLLSNHVFS